MSISNNTLIFYHTYTIESKQKSMYFTDFSIKTSFSLEYRDRFERLLGFDCVERVEVRNRVAQYRWSTETTARDQMFLELFFDESD